MLANLLRHISDAWRRVLTTIVIAIVASACVYGQQEESYKFDLGVGLGMSGYLGDANRSNLYRHPGFAGSISARYLFADTRWAIRGALATASLKGNTADYSNVFPANEQMAFTSQVYDLNVRAEFNFFAYGIGETYKRLSRWTPFLCFGLGGTMATTDGRSVAALNLPMGVGVKFKMRPRLNLEVAFTMTKTFCDRIDGESLEDPYQIKSSFFKNTDWYSMLMVGISYEFGKRCVVCHRID